MTVIQEKVLFEGKKSFSICLCNLFFFFLSSIIYRPTTRPFGKQATLKEPKGVYYCNMLCGDTFK